MVAAHSLDLRELAVAAVIAGLLRRGRAVF
jgi:hypothetical protein